MPRYLTLDEEDEDCPEYSVAISRSNTATSSSSHATTSSISDTHWTSPTSPRASPALRSDSSHSQVRRLPNPTPKALAGARVHTPALETLPLRLRRERYIYSYSLEAAGAPLCLSISVESSSGKARPGDYDFRLSLQVHGVERQLAELVTMRLTVDPRTLDFAVFLFPGKRNILPIGCLFSLRVWLRVNGIDHRIFGDDELWLGAEPTIDFATIEDASFARLHTAAPECQIYDAIVGRARVQFVVRWEHVRGRLFKYTLAYEAGGIGKSLIDSLPLRVDGDPKATSFLIYTVPVRSVPTGASHRLRVWLRTTAPDRPAAPFVYQRVWKTDGFKVGGRLDFDALGPRLIMGTHARTTVVEDSDEWSDCAAVDSAAERNRSSEQVAELA
ncbi:hypothetical protein MIND_00983900 [Mycena indigotica]|uniref:Uncharacterized protein n=1 Tax=Mycena indigotica TaxID=2126181 RepID=A0A8H6SDF2_9AGAR|nr:uncharacterized protein MIND_00983900 [Mycena indigotica]KAF7297501.1 hypothetical protein MIND_00983900 [Mycena indigotica]